MASISTTSILDRYSHETRFGDKNNIKYFSNQLTEQDILELQNIFLTCGMHFIQTNNVESGRKIITTILGSLKYYNNIGAITEIAGLQESIFDIFMHIKIDGLSSGNIVADLENFFIIHACFDFIWIEFTGLLAELDITYLKNIFDMHHVQDSMPVIFVMYDQK